MPNNKFDSKSFNAEAFKYMVARVPNLNMNEIKKSRALAANPDIQEVFSGQNGTAYARLAMRGLIDGDAVNYDGSTDITATSTKTFEQGVVVVGRAKAWKERDFSYDVTGGVDFMANISEQVAQYKDELDEATILSILKGIFAMSTTDAKNKEFVEKHTTTVSGAMTATTLNTAANKACGANKKKFTLVFCHSDVSTGLENLNLIERLKYTDKDGIQRDLELGTWNGKLVIVTDQMPVSEGYFDADANTDGALKIIASGAPADGEILLSKVTPYFGSKTLAANDYVVAGVQYTTYAMGNGAFSYEDIGVKVPYEMARDPKTNGGEDSLCLPQDHTVQPPQLRPHAALRQCGITDAIAVGVIKALNGIFKHQCCSRRKTGKLTGIQNVQKIILSFFVRQPVICRFQNRRTDFYLTTINLSFFFLTWHHFLRFCSNALCGSKTTGFTVLEMQILRVLQRCGFFRTFKMLRIRGS